MYHCDLSVSCNCTVKHGSVEVAHDDTVCYLQPCLVHWAVSMHSQLTVLYCKLLIVHKFTTGERCQNFYFFYFYAILKRQVFQSIKFNYFGSIFISLKSGEISSWSYASYIWSSARLYLLEMLILLKNTTYIHTLLQLYNRFYLIHVYIYFEFGCELIKKFDIKKIEVSNSSLCELRFSLFLLLLSRLWCWDSMADCHIKLIVL